MFLGIIASEVRKQQMRTHVVEHIPPRMDATSDRELAQRCESLFALGNHFEVVVLMQSGELRWGSRRVADVVRMYREGDIRSVEALPRKMVDDLVLGYSLVRFVA